jgi:flagellin
MTIKIGNGRGLLIDSIRKNNNESKNLLNKLASGKRINSASDDPAGLAVADSLFAQSSVLESANRNISYGYSASQIAEGATEQISGSLTRMQELAAQSANGTLSDSQREAISTEFNALRDEVDRIVGTTEFNGTNLLSGDSITIQAGADGSSSSQINVENINVEQTLSDNNFNSISIGNINDARNALDQLSALSSQVSQIRGNLGAATSRLEVAENNNSSRQLALRESESRIRDADIAEVSAKLTASKIKQQSSVALLAQSGKLDRESVLSLIG